MSFPDWIEKFRKPKTEIRFLNGQYYIYSISYKYSAELKRTKKITGKLLGKITENDGFIQSQKDKLRDMPHGSIHVAEFGVYELFLSHMEKETKYLEKAFADSYIDWKQIIAMAMIRFIYQSPIKMMDFHWYNSYFHTQWGISLSDKQISALLRELGDSRDNILAYFRQFSTVGAHLLIDTTNIPSRSTKIESVRLGYSRDMSFTPQTNLFFIFSLELQMPVYYRVVPGNIRDVKSFTLSLQESGIPNVVIVADKGFH
ncbi:MAG: transposase [Ignavibacteriales bacterium]|nr:transposase [Ignavibacteriales bacterium]